MDNASYNQKMLNKAITDNLIDNHKSNGIAYNYVACLALRLNNYLIDNPELRDFAIEVTCRIDAKCYNLVHSANGRDCGTLVSSDMLRQDLRASFDKSAVAYDATIVVFDRVPFHINLGAILGLISDPSTSFKGRSTSLDATEKNINPFADSKGKNIDMASFTTFTALNSINGNCITALPEIIEVKLIDKVNHDKKAIKWFEPYDTSKIEKYKTEARTLHDAYVRKEREKMLENIRKGNNSK